MRREGRESSDRGERDPAARVRVTRVRGGGLRDLPIVLREHLDVAGVRLAAVEPQSDRERDLAPRERGADRRVEPAESTEEVAVCTLQLRFVRRRREERKSRQTEPEVDEAMLLDRLVEVGVGRVTIRVGGDALCIRTRDHAGDLVGQYPGRDGILQPGREDVGRGLGGRGGGRVSGRRSVGGGGGKLGNVHDELRERV